jgi:hypothetical protein
MNASMIVIGKVSGKVLGIVSGRVSGIIFGIVSGRLSGKPSGKVPGKLLFLVVPIFALLCLSIQVAYADVITLRNGLGTVWQRNRDTDENTRYATLLTELSYRSPAIDLSMDIPLRWESEKWDLDREIWSRKGDLLRAIRTFMYRSASSSVSSSSVGRSSAGSSTGSHWEAGLELLSSWTPGQGYLVRGLSGAGEIDYALPGVRFLWSGERSRFEAGMDRPVDPSVQAVSFSYRMLDGLSFYLEGATDPEAPLSFTGRFQNGRPVADETASITGSAAGLELRLRNGKILDVQLGGHTARLGDGGEGLGGDLSLSFDFSTYYRNRLQVKVASVLCRDGYIPAWFDGIYPVQRWGVDGQPLLILYPLDGISSERQMESVEIRYDLGELFSMRGGVERFDDDSMSKARFDLALREESGRGLEATVWNRIDGPDGTFFSVDSNLYSRLTALYDLSSHFLLKVALEHSWAFKEELTDLVPVNSAVMGVMYNISF